MKRKFTIPIFLFVFLIWLWGIYIEPYCMLNIKNQDVYIKDFPKGFENIKIAVVSDIHAGNWFLEHKRTKRILDAVNAQNPDIILFLGDYTNGYFYQSSLNKDELQKYLSQFKAKIAKFGILGNHDAFLGDKYISDVLKNAGITPIINSNEKVSTKYGDIYIAGIADPQFMSYSYRDCLRNIPEKAPIIFLTHNPAVAREIPHRVDLVLAGHTHGGQIRLPFWGNLFPIKEVPRERVAGLCYFNNHTIYTSMGLGTSRFPVRYFCIPEFTILRIYPKK